MSLFNSLIFRKVAELVDRIGGRKTYELLCSAVQSYDKNDKQKESILDIIIRETCKEMKVTIAEVKGSGRRNERRTYTIGLIAYLGRKFTDLSFEEIGKRINKKDNIHPIYYTKIRDLQRHPDKEFVSEMSELITKLENKIKTLIEK